MFLLSIALALATAYDYNLLAVEWRPTNCLRHSDNCEKDYNKNKFGIHGLWPTNYDGKWPEYCSEENQNPFELNKDVQYLLETYWPSYKENQTAFWEHEWLRHGNCFEPAVAAPEFFTVTVNLFLSLNLEDTLAKAGVEPSNTKTYSEDEISSAFDKRVTVKCKGFKGKSYLQRISFCFSKQFRLEDCSENEKKTCESEIHYPEVERSEDL